MKLLSKLLEDGDQRLLSSSSRDDAGRGVRGFSGRRED